jgi:hypothetical protein
MYTVKRSTPFIMWARYSRVARLAAAGTAVGGLTSQLVSCEPRLAPPQSISAPHPPTVLHSQRDEKSRFTLEYFALRGLGELPRLMLEATGTPYTSVFQ